MLPLLQTEQMFHDHRLTNNRRAHVREDY
jgi:hypothetical protein